MFNTKAYSAASATSPFASTAIARRDPAENDVQVKVIAIQQVNEANVRLQKADVKYRFSIDMASLKSE